MMKHLHRIMEQTFNVPPSNKKTYGEVTTPYALVDMVLDMIPQKAYQKGTKWIDAGAGYGYFAEQAIQRLGLNRESDVHLCEVNVDHVSRLKTLYSNVHGEDFLFHDGSYDVIIGNPPYVVSGIKKVPTLGGVDKKNDGITMWTKFISKGIDLLNDGGYLAFVVPCLWMRHDKAGIHSLLLKNRVVGIRCFSASHANKLFKGHGQTPVSIVVVQKTPALLETAIYCDVEKRFISYPCQESNVLPVCLPELVKAFAEARDKYGGLRVYKTNTLPKAAIISHEGCYNNIRTVHLDGLTPRIVVEQSNIPLIWHGKSKLVLAHKMHGLPYLDDEGEYGISTRDNYVISCDDHENLSQLQTLFETKTVRCLFDAFRYRMRYLEREVFLFMFNPVCAMTNHIDDESLITFLGLSEPLANYIRGISLRKYERTR